MKKKISHAKYYSEVSLRHIPLVICGCLATLFGSAQTDSVKFNPDTSKTISISGFDSLVSNATMLLETKGASEISDLGHVNIMMCLNTIMFTQIRPGFEFIFADDKYQRLFRLVQEKDYVNNVMRIYQTDTPKMGADFYFPKLKMEVYGWPRPYAKFNVTYRDRRFTKLIDTTTGNYFVLDSAHILVSAFDRRGKTLWKTDPWKDNKLKHYEFGSYITSNLPITYFVLGPMNEKSWCKIPNGTRALWIAYGNIFGFLDIRNGKFFYCGQD
jgi:hypothetical protein